MGLSLALVTCGPQVEVALAGAPLRGVSVVRLAGTSQRSRLLMAAVDLLLEDAGVEASALERVVVTRGPGSFTGIRSGLASAAGLAAGCGADVVAYDSLTVQAGRAAAAGEVWAAQPGRKGEVYARRFEVSPGTAPVPRGEVEILSLARAAELGPWLAAETLELGEAPRATTAVSAAEALLRLAELRVPPQPAEPFYVEGPPVHRRET